MDTMGSPNNQISATRREQELQRELQEETSFLHTLRESQVKVERDTISQLLNHNKKRMLSLLKEMETHVIRRRETLDAYRSHLESMRSIKEAAADQQIFVQVIHHIRKLIRIE